MNDQKGFWGNSEWCAAPVFEFLLTRTNPLMNAWLGADLYGGVSKSPLEHSLTGCKRGEKFTHPVSCLRRGHSPIIQLEDH